MIVLTESVNIRNTKATDEIATNKVHITKPHTQDIDPDGIDYTG